MVAQTCMGRTAWRQFLSDDFFLACNPNGHAIEVRENALQTYGIAVGLSRVNAGAWRPEHRERLGCICRYSLSAKV